MTNIGDENIIATEGSQIATGGAVAAGRDAIEVKTTGGADAREGGTAATSGSAIAREGSGAAAGGSQTSIGIVNRAKQSGQFKLFGALTVIVTVVTTVLVTTGTWDLAWAGYILSALGIVVAVYPLFRGG